MKSIYTPLWLLRALGVCALLVLPAMSGADEAENQIRYRQAVMKAIGGHMGASSLIVRGKVSRRDQLKVHADGLLSLSQDIPRLFPEDSDFGDTLAKEAIWEKWDAFRKAAEESRTGIENFADAVEAGDDSALAAAFREVGKGCKGCHEDFRQKDNGNHKHNH